MARLWANLYRLSRHLAYKKEFEVLVADSSNLMAKSWIYATSCFFGADYQAIKCDRINHYSPAHIKNLAIRKAFSDTNCSHVLLLDVDVLLPDQFLSLVLSQTNKNISFDWYPVRFLDDNFDGRTMLLFIDNKNFANIKNTQVLQIGYTTGLQLISREFFKRIGGYNEKFLGYGCEDIEMIHRASLVLGLRIPYSINSVYYVDDRGYDASKLKGFRNYYYKIKEGQFSFQDMPCHFWHKRLTKSNYLQSRKNNDKLLIDIMKNFDKDFKKDNCT